MGEKLGIGIIGSGGIAQGCHMPGYVKLADQCALVAVADANPEAAKEAADKFQVPKIYGDWTELIADPEIHAVSVCTPNYAHLEPTLAALRAGKHVLCEKPLARTGDEARQMVRAAQDTGNILQVGLQWRFHPTAQYLRRYIDAGRMGEVYYARAQALRRRGIPGWGVFIDKEKQGGGPLVDIGVHILDLTLSLMNYPRPVSASGRTYQKFGKRSDVLGLMGQWDYKNFTVEDFAAALIRFENGATVVLESSFCANIKEDVYLTELMGDRAGIRLNPMAEVPVEIYGEEDGALFDQSPVFLPKFSAYEAEVAAFVGAIRDGKPSPVPGEQGLILNAIFDAIYKSSDTGREEAIDLSY